MDASKKKPQFTKSLCLSVIRKALIKGKSKRTIIEFLNKKGTPTQTIIDAWEQYYEQEGLYEVTAHEQHLQFSVSMDKTGKTPIVSSIPTHSKQLRISVGSIIYEINGKRVDGFKIDAISEMIQSLKCPYYIVFKEAQQSLKPTPTRQSKVTSVPLIIEQSSTDITKTSDVVSVHCPLEDTSTSYEFDKSALLKYGYKITDNISQNCNDCIYKAEMVTIQHSRVFHRKHNNISLTSEKAKQHNSEIECTCDEIVAIKRIKKQSTNAKIFIKEAKILHYLTIKNKSLNNITCAFIDLIETKDCFYLIQEFGESITLKKFIETAHIYIQQKRLKIKEWRVVVKYIFWQLVVDIFWMHNFMQCCHLQLNLNNIFIQDAFFNESKDNTITIDETCLTVKMSGFRLSEVFQNEEFKCNKLWLSKEYNFTAPQILNKIAFDAMKADSYSLGIILCTMCCGVLPYESVNVSDKGFCAVKNNNLWEYLNNNGLAKYISEAAFDVIKNLLNFDENKRMSVEEILQNKWFQHYYSTSKSRIDRKKETQKLKHFLQRKEMKMFPYYNCQK